MLHATLPVSSLVSANLAWVRSDFGPLEELVRDVKEHGIKQPVLIAPDYLVLDGARRLRAAEKVGVKFAPVIICHTWEKFVDNFKPMAPDAYPMNWVEIADLINRVLRPIYQEFRYRTANTTRDQRRLKGEPAPDPRVREYNYSNFIIAVAEIYGALPVHIKMLNDNVKRLHKLNDVEPELVGNLVAAINNIGPEHRRDLALIRVLKTVLDRHKRGRENATEAGNLLTAQIEASGTRNYARKKKNVLDPDAPVVSLGVIRNFADMLNTLCAQADEFRNFKPTTAYQIAEFTEAHDLVEQATGRLYRLRRRMQSALPASDPGETDKEPSDG